MRAKLRKGTLLRGAGLYPGGFVVSFTGKAGRAGLPLQMRTTYVASPP